MARIETEIEEKDLSRDIKHLLSPGATIVGELIEVSKTGEPLVQFLQNQSVCPIAALSTLSKEQVENISSLPVKVTLVFNNNRIDEPVITGLVQSIKLNEPNMKLNNDLSNDKNKSLFVDQKRIEINAEQEILLKCGKSSILLRQDGKIVIKGEAITSRSRQSNKIKGSSVSIN